MRVDVQIRAASEEVDQSTTQRPSATKRDGEVRSWLVLVPLFTSEQMTVIAFECIQEVSRPAESAP